MSYPYVIGFMGYAGTGKTTTAQILRSIASDSIEILSFAGPLKEAVQLLFLFSHDQVFGCPEEKERVDDRWGKSPRQIMQIIGTDCIRNMIDPNFHVKRLDEVIKASTAKIILVDDVRFREEADLINYYGECFNIRRPGFPRDSIRHVSEYPPIEKASGYTVDNSFTSVEEYGRALLSERSYLKHLIERNL